MSCDGNHFLTLCRDCKEYATFCIGHKTKSYIPVMSILKPSNTKSFVFDITEPQPFEYTRDGDALGMNIREALDKYLRLEGEGNQVRRFHMWIKADYVTTDTEPDVDPRTQDAEKLPVKISVLVDLDSNIRSTYPLLRSLPSRITNEEYGIDRKLKGKWTVWQGDGRDDAAEHDSSHRIKWFVDIVESPAPFMMWSNLPLFTQQAIGTVDDEEWIEHLVFFPGPFDKEKYRKPTHEEMLAAGKTVEKIEGQSEKSGCDVM